MKKQNTEVIQSTRGDRLAHRESGANKENLNLSTITNKSGRSKKSVNIEETQSAKKAISN
jgi:hypothetical protein